MQGKALAVKTSKAKPDIKTKAELEYRQKNINKPAAKLELTPASHRLIAMKKQTTQTNENRIAILRASLNKQSNNFSHQYRISVLKGEVKTAEVRQKHSPRTR